MTECTSIDVLLVAPPTDFTNYPPIGLGLIGTALLQKGIRTRILDCGIQQLDTGAVIEVIRDTRPCIVGISVLSRALHSAYVLNRAIKEALPDVVVVIGGIHVTADPGIVHAMGVRWGFAGEAEHVFDRFCQQVLAGKEPEDLPGLIDGTAPLSSLPAPALAEDIDAIPAYELFDMSLYYTHSAPGAAASIMTSRGCPYQCTFCGKDDHAELRYRSPESVLSELDLLLGKHHVKWVEIVDDMFPGNRQRALEICRRIRSTGLAFSWGTMTRADAVDAELLEAMKQAGCRKICFGIETGVERIRYADNKRISNEVIKQAVSLCREKGINVMGSFIFGHTGETDGDMRETVAYAMSLKLDAAYFGIMEPYPGTKLLQAAVENGELQPDLFLTFMRGGGAFPYYVPKKLDLAQMRRMKRKAYHSFYFSPRIMVRNIPKLVRPSYLRNAIRMYMQFGR